MKTLTSILGTLSLIVLALAGFDASAAKPASVAPVAVTASDLITKVYGVVSPDLKPADMTRQVESATDLRPEMEEGNLWLDCEDGFELSYSDMTPDVMAVACFESDSLTNYAYFFLFPYDEGSRDCVNMDQARFCGCLLQELHDMGLRMGSDAGVSPEDGTLFNAVCVHGDSLVDITLEEHTTDEGGRFVVTLNVAPKGNTDENIVWAMN
ncbi:MAG: hypothetical protein K2O24_02620 [Muribaculaceae bacterium]|nr:hypothetical protein [Muribaculaceae bacterium]